MSNKPNTRNRSRPSPATVSIDPPFWQSPWLWVGVLLALAVVLTIVVTMVGGDDNPSDTATDGGTAVQTAPVEAIGDALPRFTSIEDAAGLTVPTIAASTIDGERVQVFDDNGTPKLYMFFAHWCPHCQRELPRIVAWSADNQLPEGLEIVGISTAVDSNADNYPPSAWFAREGWPYQVLADDEQSSLALAFGLSGYPYFVAADADGHVVARMSGELTTDQFEALLDAAATGTLTDAQRTVLTTAAS